MSGTLYSEELRSGFNYLYLGQYHRCLEEVKSLSAIQYSDVLRLRALAELTPNEVITSVQPTAPIAAQAVKLYAMYKVASDDTQKDEVLATLAEHLSDSDIGSNAILQIMAAQIYLLAKNYKEALQLLDKSANTLEKATLQVQVCHHREYLRHYHNDMNLILFNSPYS